MAKKTPQHIGGRRWFQRSFGNTYHTVGIYFSDGSVQWLPKAYGYGDAYLSTALDWLKENGFVPADTEYGTRVLREDLGITFDVADVNREKDL